LLIILSCMNILTHNIELEELEIKDELYRGYILTKKESDIYSFIGIREEKDATIIAAQKRNPYSLHGYNFVQCILYTKTDKFCFYSNWIAGRLDTTLFHLNKPDPKAFALMILYISIAAQRSDQTTKGFPRIHPEAESCA